MKNFKSFLVAVVCLFLIPTCAFADDPPRDPFYSAGVELGDGPSVNAPVERVDPFSGNLSIVQTDISLPGNGGLDLKIMRFYDSAIWSRRDTSFSGITVTNEKSPLGIGWFMHMGIVRNPNGLGSNNRYAPDNPVFELPDGSRHIFYQDKTTAGRYVSTDLWVFQLKPTGEATTWEVISPEGMIYTVEHSTNAGYFTVDNVNIAQVTKIENPSRTAAITIEYDKYPVYDGMPIQYSYLDRITDSTGRRVYFTHDYALHQLERISVEGITYDYTYDSEVGSDFIRRNYLREVQPNVGEPWQYAYEMENSGFQLNSLTYPTGGKVEYTYADTFFDTGVVNVSFRVVKERKLYDRGNAFLGSWFYNYNSGSAGGAITTVNAPNGVTERHTFYGWGNCSNGTVWKIGRPIKTEVIQGALTETTDYVWTEGSVISYDDLSNAGWNGSGGQIYDLQIALPFLSQQTITRNGRNYITNYSDFDTYGNPKRIVETGHKSRTRNLTYWTSPTRNIVLGKVDYETITGSFPGSYSVDNRFLTDGRLDYSIRFGVKTDYGYDSNGNVNSIIDANLKTTTYTWGKGQIQTITKPISGYSISRVINDNGTIASETNARGYTTSFLYDGNLRLTRITPPSTTADPSNLTTIVYPADSSTRTVTRGGFVTTNSYDGFGRLVGTANSTGITSSTVYAAYGYKLSTDSNIGDKTDFDFFGRPTRVTHLGPENYSIGYQYSDSTTGALVTVTDEAGEKTVYTYNAFGNPDEQRLMKVVDAKNYSTSYEYNILGSLTKITQPGLTRSYSYDPTKNFLLTESNPETGAITYTRDAVGNINTKRDANSVTWDYTFDAINRLTSIRNLSTSGTISYAYDNADNRTSVVSPTANITVAYDAVNRPKSKTETIAGLPYSLGFRYDGNDNLRFVTYPNGRQVEYRYNAKNQVDTVPGFINGSISYTLASQPKVYTYANGVQNNYGYNARFVNETIQAGSYLNLRYMYDSRGNTDEITNYIDPLKSQDFAYDDLNRLTSFSGAWGSGAYGYDALGNRLSKTVNGQTSAYTVNSTTNYRLTAVSGNEAASYGYDNVGQVTSGSWQGASYGLDYDDHSNLKSVTKDGQPVATYNYDADGQRVVKAADSETTVYHYGLDGNVLSETKPDGTLIADYVYLYGKLVAKISPDSDGDGVGDSIDNCVDVINPDQMNSDTDALGNLCDNDDDNDGIEDDLDPYPLDDGMVVRPTPTSIAANELININVLIDDLPLVGDEVLFEQIIDLNDNGSVDLNEPVLRAFRVTDGSSVDADGTADGQISVVLGGYDRLSRDHAPGKYLLRATTETDVAIYPFAVTAVPEAQTLSGTLTDGTDPLVGAYVQLLDKWQKPVAYAITNSFGGYQFNVPAAGDYLVIPQAYGSARDLTDLTPVTVAASSAATGHDLSIIAGGYKLSGKVTDQQSGSISGILVEAVSERYVGYALTDADGNYEMLLPLGSYTIGIGIEGTSAPSQQGYVVPAAATAAASVTADIADVNLALSQASSLVTGYVLDGSSNPVAGMLITATLDGDSKAQVWTVTDDSGAYRFGLTDGDWTISLDNEYSQTLAYLSSGLTITASGTDLTGQMVTAAVANAWIEGEVSFADGRKAQYLPVVLSDSLGAIPFSVVTASDGTYRASVLADDWTVKSVGQEQVASVGIGETEIVNLVGSSILIQSPSGGEEFVTGELQTISWSASADGSSFSLEYRTSPVADWKTIADNVAGNQYQWTIPPVNCTNPQAVVRITMYDAEGQELYRDTGDYFTLMSTPCPVSYDYNTLTGKCESPLAYADPPCTDGGILNTGRDMCEITPPSCPTGYHYDSSRNRCEINPVCASGSYNASLNQCVTVTQESRPATASWTCGGRVQVSSWIDTCEAGPGGTCQARISGGDVASGNTWASADFVANFTFNDTCSVTSTSFGWEVNGNLYDLANLTGAITGTVGSDYYHFWDLFGGYYRSATQVSFNLYGTSSATYSCPSAEYSLNGTTCTINVTSYDEPVCTMDYSVDQCYASASCPVNYDLILANDLCEAAPIIASPPCSSGGVLDGSGEQCEIICTADNNIPPTVIGQELLSFNEDSSLIIDLNDVQIDDPDSNYPIGFSITVYTGDNYTVVGTTITPDQGFNGTLTVPVSVNDGYDESGIYDLTVTVVSVNDPPVISGTSSGLVLPDSPYSFIPTAFDADGDSLSFSIENMPFWASFNSVTGELSGTPDLADSSVYSGIVISVNDGTETVSLPSFDLEVRPPLAGDGDITFGTLEGVSATGLVGDIYGQDVAVQNDGKIVQVGWYGNVNDTDIVLVRYANDGNLDNSFGSAGVVTTDLGGNERGNGVLLQDDGKILVAGTKDNDIVLLRYNGDGSFDTSLAGSGYVVTRADFVAGYIYSEATSLAIQSDGKIIVVGYLDGVSISEAMVVRYNSDGSLDGSFGGGTGVVLNDFGGSDIAHDVALQSDGKIVVSGYFFIARYDLDGLLDSSFGIGGVVNTTTDNFSVLVQKDRKVVVAGMEDTTGYSVSRYNTDGTIDITFGDGTGHSIAPIGDENDYFTDIEIQADGKLLASGELYGAGGVAIVRYNLDGSLDSTFGGGVGVIELMTGGSGEIGYNVAIQPDGKVIVAGSGYYDNSYDLYTSRLLLGLVGSVVINDDSVTTEVVTVNLSPQCTNDGFGCSQMRFSNDGGSWSDWETYATEKSWTLTDGPGAKTVYAQYQDSYGNISTSTSDSISLLGNVVPVINGQNSISIPEDTTWTFTLGDLLVEDSDNSYPADFSLTVLDGLNYTRNGAQIIPAANYHGSLTVPVNVNDGTDDSNIFNLTLTVSSVNDAPVTSEDSISTQEEVIHVGALPLATDVEGDALTYSLVTDAINGSAVVNADGSFSYVADVNFTGADSFTFKVNDGVADSNVSTVSITVVNVNDAPTATSASITTNEDLASAGVAPLVTDADTGDTHTFAIETQPTNGLASVVDNQLAYTPNADFNGSDSFTFRAIDAGGLSLVGTATVSVTAVNDTPVAVDASVSTDEDVVLTGNLPTATDVDGDSLTYMLVTDASNGSVVVNGDGSYSYTPIADFNGTDSFSYKVNDGTVDSAVVTVNVTIVAVNDPPTSTSDSLVADEDAGGSGTLSGGDVDIDSLTFLLVDQATNGTVDLNAVTGEYTYTPDADFAGTDSFTYKVNDGIVDSAISTISISVTNSNDAPTATSADISTAEDTVSSGVTPSVADADSGDTHTFSIETQPADGTASVVADQLVYTPNADFNGSDSFSFRATDAGGLSVVGTATVNVTAVNDTPVAADTSVTSSEDAVVDSSLVATDVDGDSLTYSIVTAPAHGVAAITDSVTGAYTYTPEADYTGSDSFTFKVNDGTDDSNTGTVSLTISAVNDAPVITGQSPLGTEKDTALEIALSDLTVVDPDNSYPADFTLSILDGANYSHAGSTITPDTAFTGELQIPVVVNDGLIDSTQFTLTVTVTVAPSNPLTATLDVSSIDSSETAEINLLISDLAVAGGSVSVEQIADIDADGIVDSGEPVIRRLQLVDADADGSISSTINMLNTLAVDHAAGSYLLRISDGSDTVLKPFTVTPVSQIQTLQGQVIDGSNGIAGVQVQLVDKWQRPVAWAITDVNGDYLFQVPEAGGYYALPQAEGYAFDRNTATLITVVASGATTAPDVEMAAGVNTISGQVFCGVKDLAGVLVSAQGTNGNGYSTQVLTLADGSYNLLLPQGGYIIQVAADHYAGPATQGCLADTGTNLTLTVNSDLLGIDFDLPVGELTVFGVVRDEASMSVAGLPIAAVSAGETIATAVTDVNGAYDMKLAANSNYDISADTASAETFGYVSQIATVATASVDLSGQDLMAHEVDSWIEGTVTDEASVGLIDLPVTLRSDDNFYRLRMNTASDGTYSFGTFAGTWHVRAETELQGYVAAAEVSSTAQPNVIDFTAMLNSQADLLISHFSAPNSGQPGQTYQSTVRVLNQGGEPVEESFFIRVFLTNNGTLDGNEVLVSSNWSEISGLGAGVETSDQIVMLTIPAGTASGNYILVAKADADDQVVDESDEGNNTLTSTYTVALPDLIITDISSPETMQAGVSTSVSLVIKNQGSADFTSITWGFIYMSADDDVTSSDIMAGSFFMFSPVLAGGEITVTSTFNGPSIASGTYRLGATVNPTNYVVESDISNNFSTGGYVSMLAPGIDLVPISLSSPSTLKTGESGPFMSCYNNLGTQASGYSTYKVVLSEDNNITADDYGITGDTAGAVEVGQEKCSYINAIIPYGLDSGTYYLGLIVDSGDDIVESNESNNILVGEAISIVRVDPVVTPTEVLIPSSVVAEQQLTVPITFENKGTEAISGNKWTYIDVYISTESNVFSYNMGIGNLKSTIGATLYPGDAVTRNVNITIPDLPDGGYYIHSRVNLVDFTPENDDNNSLVVPVKIIP